MKIALSDLWRWDGTVTRGPFWVIGLIGFAIKYNLDRFVAATYFERSWSVFSYLIPDETHTETLDRIGQADAQLYSAFLLMAIPFIIVGLGLTIRRLRAIGWPVWLAALFFMPFVNLLFFTIIGLLPTRYPDGYHPSQAEPGEDGEAPVLKAVPIAQRVNSTFLDRLIPRSALGSAALAVLLVGTAATGLTILSVQGLEQYGLALFVGIPFAAGLASALIFGYHEPRSLIACCGVGLLTSVLFGAALVALAFEGIFCIIMAAPIGGGLSVLGALVGYAVQVRPGAKFETAATLGILLVAVPVLMGAEAVEGREPPLIKVTTDIIVDAPPAAVWRNVVEFSELPPPKDKLFLMTGIAYPLRARIEGRGVGAVRHCEFTTGPFVEPITVWDEPRLLRFDVTSQPRSMEESSPWGQIDAPHIDDYLISEGGQFLLTELPGGRTRVEGTTWYRHKIWPATYWRVWSDLIIHSIHERVLTHVKALSEAE